MKSSGHKALALALPLVLLLPAEAGLFDRVQVTPHDAVTTPGAAVAVEAKYERDWFWYFNPDLRNEPARFTFGGGLRANARTNWDGVAAIGVRAGQTGIYPFVAEAPRRNNASANGRLFVIDPAVPVAVIDIDHTLSDMSSLQVPFSGASAATFPGAVSLVDDLARTHAIVYLTARDDTFDAITRAFLARHRFPDAPIIYNDMGFTTWAELQQLDENQHGHYKLRAIRGLQARGVNVVLGIGDKDTDAYAYESAGILSFIHTTAVATTNSYHFVDYTQLRLELVARGILP